ncbi:MAG: extracellular solute-binding protein [Butyrivibrio sp.]|nr:extracellular solute-binding protein [Butyrivibrio sp.]
MRLRTKLLSILLIACAIAGTVYYSSKSEEILNESQLFKRRKTTVRLWYTDSALTDYLTAQAVSYNESNNKVRVEPVLTSGLEYLEAINTASVNSEEYPDLYIITNDSLEKAYLSGLATEIDSVEAVNDPEVFSNAAINAVTYEGKIIGYPYYFETSALLYNKTYLEDKARADIEAEIDASVGEAAQQEIDESEEITDESIENSSVEMVEADISDEEVQKRVQEMIPSTIAQILSFAENYNAPEQVEGVFKWDVTDILYNYCFVGNYLNVGGLAGDDTSQIDIYNADTISCMKMYQELNQFFAIDSETATYDSIMDEFINGKMVFTLATTDSIAKIEQAKEEGTCDFEYGVSVVPDITDNYKTRTMSVTDCIVVNGYSENQAAANAFARFLCSDNTEDIYKLAGKVSAHYGVQYENTALTSFMKVYEQSVPLPKMIETSNFWAFLEIAFTEIWNGKNVNSTLKALNEKVMMQITGQEYVSEEIPDPESGSITDGINSAE